MGRDLVIIAGENDTHGATGSVDYIEDAGLVREGMFAELLQPIQLRDSDYPFLQVGDILLIEKLKFANNVLHTVVLRDHPRNCIYQDPYYFSYLFDDFCAKFKVISAEDGQAIRDRELLHINAETDSITAHLADLKNNPNQFMAIAMDIYSKRLNDPNKPKSYFAGNISGLLGQANALEQIESINNGANMATDLMEIRKNYIEERVNKIKESSDIVKSFYTEKCAGFISSTTEVVETTQKINDGIESLNLFTLKNVRIDTVMTGQDAPEHVPLTLTQERILADVELSFYKEKNALSLDISNAHIFFDELKSNPAFVKQIFPTERCVVACALREPDIDYKDNLYNFIANRENKATFLMVRNGENIHVVRSPIDSHLAANMLFPAKKYMDELYEQSHSELNITIDSLNYADVVNEIDRVTLHFKRFLLLLAGLQMQKGLLGMFYPLEETFNIFSLDFQESYMHFIYDASGEGLISQSRPDLDSWIRINNAKLRKGSNILVASNLFVTPNSAPTCYKRTDNRNNPYKRIKTPTKPYLELQVEQDESGYYVRMPFKRDSDQTDKEVRSKVWIDELNRTDNWQVQYMVLDYINPEELSFYIG